MAPASIDNPRFLTRQEIEEFEATRPALKGIGRIMVRAGIWVIVEKKDDADDRCSTGTGAVV
jgi:hypothetical protein